MDLASSPLTLVDSMNDAQQFGSLRPLRLETTSQSLEDRNVASKFFSAAAVLLGLFAAAPAASADDLKEVVTCVETENGANRDAHGCIGRIADACTNTPDGQSTQGEVACAQQETKAWDALLNEEYAALLKLMKPEAVEDIRKAQRIWLTSRDADCRVPYYFYEGGTIVGIIGARCELDHTGDRALLIRSWRRMAQGE